MDWTWVATGLLAIVTFVVANAWFKRRGLPPGPIPLPIVGNILAFRGNVNADEKLMEWKKKYGNIFTIWVGNDPLIVVTDWDTIREALVTQRNSFSGRVLRLSNRIFLDGSHDVIFSDFGPGWEILRKMLALAVRKYSTSEKLPLLIEEIADNSIDVMLKKKTAFDIKEITYLTVFNILASTAFGKRYNADDKDFKYLIDINEDINEEFNKGLPSDFMPYLRYLFLYRERKMLKTYHTYLAYMKNEFLEHKATYVSGVVRDFTDAMLASKEEAEAEDKNTMQYLTDEALTFLLFDFFSAGTDTTRISLMWLFLYLSQYPDLQEKVREEILSNIGDRMPVQEDMKLCPYTIAFITETLRVKPIISLTLEHKAICDAQLCGYKIPKDTGIIFNILSSHFDKEHWSDPNEFRPERFLEEDGSFTKTRMVSYFPFGLGRRGCPGEKLAKADIFLVMTRFLQKVRFSLEDGPNSADLEPQNILLVKMPKPYKVKVELVSV